MSTARKTNHFILIFAILLFSFHAGATWQENLETLLTTTDETVIELQMKQLLSTGIDWKPVAATLQNQTFVQPEQCGVYVENQIMCSDGVERPYVVYIPENYRSDTPVPLLVVLHGGVGWPDLPENAVEDARGHEITRLIEEEGWLALFPFGQKGAVWWDDVGMPNILNQIRTVKQQYNVDDNRVWMQGFSDGASASFMFAMSKPNYFAAFVPLNGHMGVAALDGELTTCPANLANSPVHTICTDLDGLYPARMMRPVMKMALEAGADLVYREYNGIGHDFDYADTELPIIGNFLNTHSRNRFPSNVFCESVGPELGWMRWLRIEEINPGKRAEWHKDHNIALKDERITFGFMFDDKYTGSGMKVNEVPEGQTMAQDAGLQAGDIIIQCQGFKIETSDDLSTAKKSLKRGQDVELTVLREGKETVLTGALPPVIHYLLFPQRQPTGALRGQYYANTFVIDSSQVAEFTLFIHPEMVQLDQPVRVLVDGVEKFNGLIEPDVEFMVRQFLEHRDRELLYINSLTIQLNEPMQE